MSFTSLDVMKSAMFADEKKKKQAEKQTQSAISDPKCRDPFIADPESWDCGVQTYECMY